MCTAKQINLEKQPVSEFSPISLLIALGREKSYVTLDDILKYFPKPETDMDQLERVFALLLSAGIPYIDENPNQSGE
jgi:RNA polymerase primary sigma factor